MPIETSPNIPGARPVGAVDARIVRGMAGARDQQSGAPAPVASPSGAAPTYQPSGATDPGQAPVDMERVKVIQHAIQTGTYPVIPTRIADAMIADGLLLRSHA